MGMARVSSGWASGNVALTVGGTTVALPLDDITSAVAMALRVAEVLTALGLTVQPYATEAGVLAWSASSDFAWSAAGVIQSRLALSSSGSGTHVTATGAHYGGWYPAHGMSLEQPVIATVDGLPVADGSGATGAIPGGQRLRLEAHGDLSAIWALEDDLGLGSLWDLWAGGRWRGRLRVEEVERRRLGRAANHASLSLVGRAYFAMVTS